MPQDSLRSVVYRSFVTCDDPKGVVECRTFRKSKTNSHKMEGRVENHRTQRNLNASSSTYKEESKEMPSKGIADSPSSFQLIEVSKGAQKLNRVIDSWSMGMTFDGESKDIAKDLLKGAIDLQESLIMLGKLQEASQYMAKLKKKEEKSRGGRIDEMGGEKTNSNQFGDQNYCTGSQKPRLSVDGCSRDCYEELRRVIRDSLARQNLLPNHSNREKAYCDRRASDADQDIPSTSSSQSSLVCSCRFAPPESSLSSKAPQKKPNGPNLVAKLMGLEEITSKSLQSTHKQLECDKISNQRRPIFDIDMPKARKSKYVGQKVDPERRTMKEILDNMQFKGLLKCNSVENFKPPSYHSEASHSKNRSIDNEIPIVLLKPLSYSCLEAEEPCTQMFVREEGALDTRDVLRKLRTKEELSPKTIECGERVLCSNEMCRNHEADKPPMKRFSQEEVKDCKEVVAETVVKTKEKMSSNKKRAPVPIKNKAQKEAFDKKVDKVQKMVQNRRKPEETENLKSKGASVSHNQVKVTSSKPRNPEKGSNIVKNRFAQPKSITSNPISKSTAPTTSHSSSDQKKNLKNTTRNISHKSADQKKNHKNEKQVKEPVAAKFAIETMACEDDNKGINITCENESDLIRTDTVSVDQLLVEEEPESTDASEIKIKDHCIDTQNSLCEVTLQTIPHEISFKSDEAANYCISHNSTEQNLFNTKTNPQDFLLSSPLFLNHAEELFNINTNQSIFSQKVSVNDSRIADTGLLLDCANELMELKSLQCTRTVHPILHAPVRYARICIPLYQLVDELCDGIENLRSYGKLVGKNLPIDSVYAALERDLSCHGVGSGAWDLGWRNGFTVDEVEQVVVGIEKLVLGCLIEEVLTGFLL